MCGYSIFNDGYGTGYGHGPNLVWFIQEWKERETSFQLTTAALSDFYQGHVAPVISQEDVCCHNSLLNAGVYTARGGNGNVCSCAGITNVTCVTSHLSHMSNVA
jgi:hypothetical protein